MKSRKFDTWKYIGDALNTAKIFNEKDTDELVILDVEASREQREPNYELLRALSAECFLPLAYGGGVNSALVAKRIVECGIDKVVVNSALSSNPSILTQISDSIGSSSTMASLDFINSEKGEYQLRNKNIASIGDTVFEIQQLGAGELLIQSVELDGTRAGPDLNLASRVLEVSSIPVVYAGGVTSLDDASSLWRLGIDGVAAGSWFVFKEPHDAVLVTYPSRKKITEAAEKE